MKILIEYVSIDNWMNGLSIIVRILFIQYNTFMINMDIIHDEHSDEERNESSACMMFRSYP